MRTAIYIEDGVIQLVLTPESDWEKSAINSFHGKKTKVTIFDGTFYDCRGGWVRQNSYYGSGMYGSGDSKDKSLILRVDTGNE